MMDLMNLKLFIFNLDKFSDNKYELIYYVTKNNLKEIYNIEIFKNINTLTENSFFLYIDYNYFIEFIQKSFNEKNTIEKQFIKDYPRCSIKINDHIEKNIKNVLSYLDFKFNENFKNIILMLSTQAVMALVFEIITMNIYKNNYFLAEPNNKNDKQFKLNLDLDANNIHFNIFKELRIFNLLDNGEIKNIIKVFITINIDINKPISTKIELISY